MQLAFYLLHLTTWYFGKIFVTYARLALTGILCQCVEIYPLAKYA